MEIDEAAKISAEIDSWQSPRLGNIITGRRRSYEEDTNEFLLEATDATPMHVRFSPAPTTRLLNRMDTPAKNNNSSRQSTQDEKMEIEDDDYPHGIQSPWLNRPTAAAATPIVRRSNPSFQSSHTDYQRYYDACLTYLRDRRRLSERMALQKEKAALFQDATAMMIVDEGGSTLPDQKLIKDESQVELEFLRALNFACWDRSSSIDDSFRKEGNCWLLLFFLRQQGTTSLLWDDSPSALLSYTKIISSHLMNLATFVKCSDKDLLDALLLNESGCPLVLKRRQRILTWLEKCFEDVLPSGATRPRKTKYLENSKLTREGLPETDKDPEILKCVLALILSGRLTDAQKLARDSDIPWRAAVWGGGSPDDGISAGNPRRFLWKSMMWIQAEKLSGERGSSSDEAAISALLSSNLTITLNNASCRTWQHGLYATFRAMLERTEDELLHFRNSNRRRMIPYFPVAEHEKVEVAYLKDTSGLAGWNERDAIHTLKTAPFECMQGCGTIDRTIASFITGKDAVTEFMSGAICKVENESCLRFLTHIALYLDSLACSTSQIFLDGSVDWKNELLIQYVEHLASREDLWYMIVLYASLLPQSYIYEQLPEYLTAIESPQEKEVIVRQLRELLPGDDWDIEVLKHVVNLMLDEKDNSEDINKVTRDDYRKMKSVDWLAFDDRHCGEALVAANRLVRQFLLVGKTISANTFTNEVPDAILDNVSKLVDVLEADSASAGEQDEELLRLQQAHSEFIAFKAYLDALKAYEQWNLVERSCETTISATIGTLENNRLNEKELEIARRETCRQLIFRKRDISGNVVSAANEAQLALRAVLEHPGGWLAAEDDANSVSDGEKVRQLELRTLRSELVPGVVKLYQSVCASTAEWMAASLDNLALQLEQNRHSALHNLDESSLGFESAVSPKYWAKQGIELLNIVSSEKDKIQSEIGPDDLKTILETTCRLAILEMQY